MDEHLRGRRRGRPPGFTAHLSDVLGAVSTDYYGNPTCTLFTSNRRRPGRGGRSSTRTATQWSTRQPRPESAPERRHRRNVMPNLGPAGTAPPWRRRPATGRAVGQDHHARRCQGPGRLGPGGRDRLRQRVPQGRRGRTDGAVRVRPARAAIDLAPASSEQTGDIKGTIMSPNVHRRPRPESLTRPASRHQELRSRSSNTGWRSPTSTPATPRSTSVRAPPTEVVPDPQRAERHLPADRLGRTSLEHIMWSFNVVVKERPDDDVGNEMLVGWFTHIRGHVFIDSNANGQQRLGGTGCRWSSR